MKFCETIKKFDFFKISLNSVQNQKHSKGTVIGGIYSILLMMLIIFLIANELKIIITKEKFSINQYTEEIQDVYDFPLRNTESTFMILNPKDIYFQIREGENSTKYLNPNNLSIPIHILVYKSDIRIKGELT